MGLSVEQAQDVCNTFFSRRDRFPDEGEEMTLMVVLLNYGDKFTSVTCVNGEFVGKKGDIASRDGIPLCPNGHPLFESNQQLRLTLAHERV